MKRKWDNDKAQKYIERVEKGKGKWLIYMKNILRRVNKYDKSNRRWLDRR